MKSYADVTNFISQAIDELSLTEHIRFLQNLIYQFVRDLPIDWLDNELDSEKPITKLFLTKSSINHGKNL